MKVISCFQCRIIQVTWHYPSHMTLSKSHDIIQVTWHYPSHMTLSKSHDIIQVTWSHLGSHNHIQVTWSYPGHMIISYPGHMTSSVTWLYFGHMIISRSHDSTWCVISPLIDCFLLLLIFVNDKTLRYNVRLSVAENRFLYQLNFFLLPCISSATPDPSRTSANSNSNFIDHNMISWGIFVRHKN